VTTRTTPTGSDAAVRLLQRVVEADRQDSKMGHPNPGDSCIGICLALEVMPFLDGLGKLPAKDES
jgi:hypothetical protein